MTPIAHVRHQVLVEQFSYLSVLLSIIIGLAMTEILQGYRRLLFARRRVRWAFTPLCWSVLLLLFATQMWWSSFGLRSVAVWTFGGFCTVLLQTALLYLMAAVILPDEPVDLAAHYQDTHRTFFALMLGLVAVSILKDRVINDEWPTSVNLLFHAALALVAVLGIALRGARAHLALGAATTLWFAAYIALMFTRL